jgi:hypothetical protein
MKKKQQYIPLTTTEVAALAPGDMVFTPWTDRVGKHHVRVKGFFQRFDRDGWCIVHCPTRDGRATDIHTLEPSALYKEA